MDNIQLESQREISGIHRVRFRVYDVYMPDKKSFVWPYFLNNAERVLGKVCPHYIRNLSGATDQIADEYRWALGPSLLLGRRSKRIIYFRHEADITLTLLLLAL